MRDLHEASDPDIRGSVAAMKRAAQSAREIAIQTNTDLIIMKNDNIVRISPEELRQDSVDN
ncbi:MAG TPA: hypothetical protein DEB19_02850 [Synechococcales bacterium UBA8138]|nr:hypothetical protein [Synechococcales bacterium UBA8138]